MVHRQSAMTFTVNCRRILHFANFLYKRSVRTLVDRVTTAADDNGEFAESARHEKQREEGLDYGRNRTRWVLSSAFLTG